MSGTKRHGEPRQSPGTVRCQGCGGRATGLTQQDAITLRKSFIECVSLSVRAFECRRCEVVIYEDELTLGKFVPPQFKRPTGSTVPATGTGGTFSAQAGQNAIR